MFLWGKQRKVVLPELYIWIITRRRQLFWILYVEYNGTKQLYRLRTKLQRYWLLCAVTTPVHAYRFSKLCGSPWGSAYHYRFFFNEVKQFSVFQTNHLIIVCSLGNKADTRPLCCTKREIFLLVIRRAI